MGLGTREIQVVFRQPLGRNIIVAGFLIFLFLDERLYYLARGCVLPMGIKREVVVERGVVCVERVCCKHERGDGEKDRMDKVKADSLSV